MARTLAELPKGSRISDYISLGVIVKTFPVQKIQAVLTVTGKASRRQRDLPAHVVVYYVIALALCMRSSCRDDPRHVSGPKGRKSSPLSASGAGASAVRHLRVRHRLNT